MSVLPEPDDMRRGWASVPGAVLWHYFVFSPRSRIALSLCGRGLNTRNSPPDLADEVDDPAYNCCPACKKLLAAERAKAVA